MKNLDLSLREAISITGALGVALGDWKSGMCLGASGSDLGIYSAKSLEAAIATNSEVIQAKFRDLQAMNLQQGIEDILITLDSQYHLIRLVRDVEGLFFFIALDREKSNLALARLKLAQIEEGFEF